MATTYQMQGLNTATHQLITWLSSNVDWTGAQAPGPVSDVALYAKSRSVAAPVVVVPIVCAITSPTAGATETVGAGITISGTISRAGTVSLTGLGAATVVGLAWSFFWTPVSGDVGSKTITAVASDLVNGTTSSASVTVVVAAAPVFPSTVTPAVWFDGNRQAYTDSAGTIPAVVGDRVRRINEASPLTGVWSSASDNERPYRDGNALRFECLGPAHGHQMTRPAASGISSAACTIVVAFVARDNSFAGPQVGLIRSDDGNVGVTIASNQVWVYYNGFTTWFSTLTITPGVLNTIAVTYSATGIALKVNAAGVDTTQSLTASITATTMAAVWRIGVTGTGYLYGSVPQAIVVASILSNTDRDAVMTWVEAQPVAPAYPDTETLLVWVGDSIQRATGVSYDLCYPFLTLPSIRTAGFPAENCDVAVGGTGVTALIDPSDLTPNRSLLRRGAAFYSATRVHNVLIFCLGTNDLANGNPTAYTLHGTGSPGIAGSGIYPACDYARAIGWKVILMTLGPRSDAPAVANGYNAARAIVNADILANGHLHADLVLDTTQIVHWGFDGDSNNSTYYQSDLVHPTAAGHALVAPAVIAAVLSLI